MGGQNIVFDNFNLQAGNDETGVPTDLLSLNSTVRILYRNPGTFFGVHVTSTPLDLHYYQLKVATGHVSPRTSSISSPEFPTWPSECPPESYVWGVTGLSLSLSKAIVGKRDFR